MVLESPLLIIRLIFYNPPDPCTPTVPSWISLLPTVCLVYTHDSFHSSSSANIFPITLPQFSQAQRSNVYVLLAQTIFKGQNMTSILRLDKEKPSCRRRAAFEPPAHLLVVPGVKLRCHSTLLTHNWGCLPFAGGPFNY